jgi:hypothetical protein
MYKVIHTSIGCPRLLFVLYKHEISKLARNELTVAILINSFDLSLFYTILCISRKNTQRDANK